jgi:hypothetical protein
MPFFMDLNFSTFARVRKHTLTLTQKQGLATWLQLVGFLVPALTLLARLREKGVWRLLPRGRGRDPVVQTLGWRMVVSHFFHKMKRTQPAMWLWCHALDCSKHHSKSMKEFLFESLPSLPEKTSLWRPVLTQAQPVYSSFVSTPLWTPPHNAPLDHRHTLVSTVVIMFASYTHTHTHTHTPLMCRHISHQTDTHKHRHLHTHLIHT